MGLRLLKRFDAPPDWYRYVVPQTGYAIRSLDRDTWVAETKNYLRINSLPIQDDLVEQMEDQCCQFLPPGWCQYTDGGQPSDFIDTRLTVDDVLRGTMALAEIMARRAAYVVVPDMTPFVPQELAESRAATCASCYAKVQLSGCISCVGYTGKVDSVIGNRHTRSDASLETSSCAICKCSAKAQVHVKTEILAKGVDAAMLERFQKIPHCWKGIEVQQYLTEQAQAATPAP